MPGSQRGGSAGGWPCPCRPGGRCQWSRGSLPLSTSEFYIFYVVCAIFWVPSYPDANKLLVENDPGQKVDKRGIGGKEGGHHGAVQDPERCYVEVVGQH